MAGPTKVDAAAAGAGAASVVLGVGLGELSAGILGVAGPITAMGGWLIDLAPAWAKDTAIALFGTADKIALVVGIGIVLLLAGAACGVLEARRPPWGRVIVLVVGAVGAVVSMTRAEAGPVSWLPSAIAGITAALTLWLLIRMLRPALAAAPRSNGTRSAEPPPAPAAAPPAPDAGPSPSRRTFLVWTGVAAAAGILTAAAGTAMRAGSTALAAIKAVVLPTPAVAATAVPASAELGIPGLATVVTPNESFYRIDTALIVPRIDPADWSLRIHGLVENEVTVTWDELLALPLEESHTTLACVSNEVGGTLIGNALWLGYPVRELLARAKPSAEADMVLSRSIDGFTASTPLEALTDDRAAILAVGMNGEPLPLEHGFPARLVVPGLYGYVSATKWVTALEVTRFDRAKGYWTDRGWSERGPIKLQSRIDVPRKAQGLKAGETVIAGVAWQQHVGVARVEVQIDEGTWEDATLATAISDDTWVQWSLPWTATAGDHLIRCRATSSSGEVQTPDRASTAPDGATGWHERFVTVF
ncbi:molybdopterin-dependent oxidoreductase [Microbacterium sp. CFBP9034]|uniref:molybdopterin-dependent oxidoreductase n=1 Tax=Microbacterium sp. CFBP9034 TaxID=3096540 RepID=UPI002A6B8C21|nr:molybdopterin-dependent oxidoreductase [Microbacterium sp. CFBP9034]MDY0908396.1 molybdopterin-dependent oxidoreductase [Microbacterium sp. CFBP9034]